VKIVLKQKTIHIEKVPEKGDTKTWAIFNKKLNDLGNTGFKIMYLTDTYILMIRENSLKRIEE
jgi:hypothetical protein